MPRISSTSSISGTGFMKWMPMKRSGRSVAAASRVIEIDEVLVATMRLGLQRRAELGEDLALDLFLLGRRLDHEVAVAERVVARRRVLMRFSAACVVVLGDALARDLARHVAVDGGERLLDARRRRRR